MGTHARTSAVGAVHTAEIALSGHHASRIAHGTLAHREPHQFIEIVDEIDHFARDNLLAIANSFAQKAADDVSISSIERQIHLIRPIFAEQRVVDARTVRDVENFVAILKPTPRQLIEQRERRIDEIGSAPETVFVVAVRGYEGIIHFLLTSTFLTASTRSLIGWHYSTSFPSDAVKCAHCVLRIMVIDKCVAQ